jgi:hypothetical protein
MLWKHKNEKNLGEPIETLRIIKVIVRVIRVVVTVIRID